MHQSRKEDSYNETRYCIISLIPKPDKDSLIIENWRAMTLLTIDYKILGLVYDNRLKNG